MSVLGGRYLAYLPPRYLHPLATYSPRRDLGPEIPTLRKGPETRDTYLPPEETENQRYLPTGQDMVQRYLPRPMYRMTHTCKNITFRQLRWRAVKWKNLVIRYCRYQTIAMLSSWHAIRGPWNALHRTPRDYVWVSHSSMGTTAKSASRNWTTEEIHHLCLKWRLEQRHSLLV